MPHRLTYRLHECASDVDPSVWQSVVNRYDHAEFVGIRFLSVVERTMADQADFWYVVVADDRGQAVACACLCRFRIDALVLGGRVLKMAMGKVRRLWPSFMYLDILMDGLPVSLGQSQIRIAPEADHREVLRLLDEIMVDLARRIPARLIVHKEFTPSERDRMDTLSELGYVREHSLPMHCFPTGFADFEAYCAALNSHYRSDIRRSQRKLAGRGIRVTRLIEPDVISGVYTSEVHALYEAVVNRSETKLEVLPAEFFRELAQQFPGQLSMTVLQRGERIVAFNFVLRSGRTHHFMFCGMDYELNADFDLYFNLMYADLNSALRDGASEIQVGQTADSFKARLGCAQIPLCLYAKGSGRIPAWLFSRFSSMLFPERFSVTPGRVFRANGCELVNRTLVEGSLDLSGPCGGA